MLWKALRPCSVVFTLSYFSQLRVEDLGGYSQAALCSSIPLEFLVGKILTTSYLSQSTIFHIKFVLQTSPLHDSFFTEALTHGLQV